MAATYSKIGLHFCILENDNIALFKGFKIKFKRLFHTFREANTVSIFV